MHAVRWLRRRRRDALRAHQALAGIEQDLVVAYEALPTELFSVEADVHYRGKRAAEQRPHHRDWRVTPVAVTLAGDR